MDGIAYATFSVSNSGIVIMPRVCDLEISGTAPECPSMMSTNASNPRPQR